ncbi:hypothetical protein ACFX2I_026414 [Malus domestica]
MQAHVGQKDGTALECAGNPRLLEPPNRTKQSLASDSIDSAVLWWTDETLRAATEGPSIQENKVTISKMLDGLCLMIMVLMLSQALVQTMLRPDMNPYLSQHMRNRAAIVNARAFH